MSPFQRPVWLCLLALAPCLAAAQSMQEIIGVGDTVRITAFRHPELTTQARVTEEGKVNVPLVGPLELEGMTPEQAAKRIEQRLVKGDFIKNPQIDVAIVQARSRQVSVLGQVGKPGRYMLEGASARVADVIAMAGGLGPTASQTAVVQRGREGERETLKIDLAAVLQGGDPSKNIELRSGDSVFVPEAPVFYVYGEVMRGGAYRLQPGMTVMQAISLAGGVSPRGSERGTRLRRQEPDGKWKERSARPYDPVSANDVIYVRESLF